MFGRPGEGGGPGRQSRQEKVVGGAFCGIAVDIDVEGVGWMSMGLSFV